MFIPLLTRQRRMSPIVPLWMNSSRTVVLTFIFTCLVLGCTTLLFRAINAAQPTPYMDEVFHVDQALQYCNGNFTYWNPKITTLPGLYMLSVGIIIPLENFFNYEPGCSVYSLRLSNLVAWGVLYYVLVQLQKRLFYRHQKRSDSLIRLSALTLNLLPVGYFFTFLYYTDPISTALVLSMINMHLNQQHYFAALCGIFATLVRQTNIIWVGFCALDLLLRTMERQEASLPWRKDLSRTFNHPVYVKTMFYCLMENLRQGFPIRLILDFLKSGSGYVAVWVLFLLFLVVNNGIVVGDRSAHQAVLHLPQILYFSFFTLCFGFPYFIPMVQPFLRAIHQNKLYTLYWCFLMMICIYFFTMAHPYILADNRHYVFYIWQRIYQRHFLAPYLLIPVYLFSGYAMVKLLKHNGFMFQTVYCLCLIGCLVPQKLLEFRYFLIPYLLFRLNIKITVWQLFAECMLYIIVNMITIYLFFFKPFYWPDSSQTQRFIW